MDWLVAALGLSGWKPVLTALALPPLPFIMLMLLAVRFRRRQRRAAWTCAFVGAAGIWLSCCIGVGAAMERWLLRPPSALSEPQIAQIKRDVVANKTVVLVLSGGKQGLAPEYGTSQLTPRSMQRLHYGIWLARRVGAPLMVSGGVGLAQSAGPPEAEVAARIAERDYGFPVRWTETVSRDTRENASASLIQLQNLGVGEVLLVTHGWHMPRALRAFRQMAGRQGAPVRVVPAPMGMAESEDRPVMRWLPTPEGFGEVRQALREMLGMLVGA